MQSTLDGKVPLVVIDIHETKGKSANASKILIDMLSRENIEYRIDALPIGDILLPHGIIVERKTFSDFVNSLKGSTTGVLRLENQISSMIEAYKHPILLIEDGLAIRKDPLGQCVYVPIKRYPRGKNTFVTIERKISLNPRHYNGLIRKFENMGVHVIQTFNAKHAAIVLFNMIKGILSKKEKSEDVTELLFSTSTKESIPIIRSRPKLMDIADFQEFFLAGLPMINTKRAQLILRAFKTPIDALKRIDEWEKIPTVGKKIVKEVKKVLFTEYSRGQTDGRSDRKNS
ncbi:MAG: ERCC4 domain-containing protein [Candidatus Asgardarchaeia archaeon]